MAGNFYLYELVDPRCGSVFYVGKGKGKRRDQHTREAVNGGQGPKCEKIRAIIADGYEPASRIVAYFDDELEAYSEEIKLIAKHGISNLTNICIGGRGGITENDAVANARNFIKSNSDTFRQIHRMQDAGLKLKWRDFDFIKAGMTIAMQKREIAGHRYYNEVVGIA